MNNEIYIGIDGGNAGGIVALQGKKILFKEPMPIMQTTDSRNEYDLNRIIEILSRFPDATIIFEKAHAMPKLGTVQAFNFGKGFGMMLGVLSALQLRYHVVHSRTWQTLLFRDQPHGDTKQASRIVARRLFPTEDFRATPKSKKDADGLTDATLIAYYGQNYLYKK